MVAKSILDVGNDNFFSLIMEVNRPTEKDAIVAGFTPEVLEITGANSSTTVISSILQGGPIMLYLIKCNAKAKTTIANAFASASAASENAELEEIELRENDIYNEAPFADCNVNGRVYIVGENRRVVLKQHELYINRRKEYKNKSSIHPSASADTRIRVRVEWNFSSIPPPGYLSVFARPLQGSTVGPQKNPKMLFPGQFRGVGRFFLFRPKWTDGARADFWAYSGGFFLSLAKKWVEI
jgi:hypothetical protein